MLRRPRSRSSPRDPPPRAQLSPLSSRRWGAQDLQARKYHPAPAAQFVVYLSGEMTVTTSDGQTRRFGPGDVLRVEDVAPCKGHISVVGGAPSHTLVVR